MDMKRTKQESRRVIAQDQESDSLKMKSKAKQTTKPELQEAEAPPTRSKNDQKKMKGRSIQPSRLNAHPLPKVRKPQEPRRIQPKQPQQKQNPALQRQITYTNKKGIQMRSKPSGNTIVHNKINVPKRKDLTAEGLQSRLKKKSPWFQSVISPVDGGGVKIPDPIGTDTGTYQHIENVTVPVNAQGVAGLRVLSPYINSATAIGTTDGLNYQVTSDSSTIDEILWSDAASTPTSGIAFAKVPALMKANARSHRVVSACVNAQAEVSTLNDEGECCAFVTPFSCTPNAQTYNVYSFQYDSTIVPNNVHRPVQARWYPVEAEAFAIGADTEFSVSEIISYQDFIDPTDANFANQPNTVCPWEFGVLYVGTGTGNIRFQIVINYEFIPLFQTAMVTSSPSPIDEVEEQLVNKWIGDTPATQVISQHEISKAPTVSTVGTDNEPTGLGMLFNVIEEAIPFIGKALPLLL